MANLFKDVLTVYTKGDATSYRIPMIFKSRDAAQIVDFFIINHLGGYKHIKIDHYVALGNGFSKLQDGNYENPALNGNTLKKLQKTNYIFSNETNRCVYYVKAMNEVTKEYEVIPLEFLFTPPLLNAYTLFQYFTKCLKKSLHDVKTYVYNSEIRDWVEVKYTKPSYTPVSKREDKKAEDKGNTVTNSTVEVIANKVNMTMGDASSPITVMNKGEINNVSVNAFEHTESDDNTDEESVNDNNTNTDIDELEESIDNTDEVEDNEDTEVIDSDEEAVNELLENITTEE